MTTWTHFNVNDYVKVQLTEHGRAVHRTQHELLLGHLPNRDRCEFPYSPPDEDEDGWSKWQLWSLLKTFGPHVWITGEMCFRTGIQFETK
jgi:hypothetical protein